MGRVLAELSKQHETAIEERTRYNQTIDELTARDVQVTPEDAFSAEMAQYAARKADLHRHHGESDAELAALREESRGVGEETTRLEETEYAYWRDFNRYQIERREGEDEWEALRRGGEVERAVLSRLRATKIVEERHLTNPSLTVHPDATAL